MTASENKEQAIFYLVGTMIALILMGLFALATKK